MLGFHKTHVKETKFQNIKRSGKKLHSKPRLRERMKCR